MQIQLLIIPFGAFFPYIVPRSTNDTEMFYSPEEVVFALLIMSGNIGILAEEPQADTGKA
jgi:hypothetical protein